MYTTAAMHLALNTNIVLTGVFGALFGHQSVISGPYPRKQCIRELRYRLHGSIHGRTMCTRRSPFITHLSSSKTYVRWNQDLFFYELSTGWQLLSLVEYMELTTDDRETSGGHSSVFVHSLLSLRSRDGSNGEGVS